MQTFNKGHLISHTGRFANPAQRAQSKPPHLVLVAILLVYAALSILMAVTTPAWQNPDEPAHYNYIAHIGEGKGLPYLQMGDYDGDYIGRLTREHFPPHLSIEPLRYEFHQPPLYYLLATPIYVLSGGSLLALRLFSVLLGGGVVGLIFLTVRKLFPSQPVLAAGAAAFAALLPMNVAIMAAVNNDSLAGLIIAGTLYVLLLWLESTPAENGSIAPAVAQRWYLTPNALLLILGLLIGLGFLTKATTYVLLPVVVLTVWGSATHRWGWQRGVGNAALVLPWALLLGISLWLRNLYLYGGFDFLGLAWHDRVVTGQPTTVDWIATYGWDGYLGRAWRFTFSSFWGVFGWMGVFMDSRIYTALTILSAIAGIGLLSVAMRIKTWLPRLRPGQQWMLFALLLLLLSVGASYIWYNLGFVQHQGRYLFPALLPIGLLFAVGWRAVLRPPISVAGAVVLFIVMLAYVGFGLTAGAVSLWNIVLLGTAIVALLINAALALRQGRWHRPHPLIFAAPYALLALLDVAAPFLYIVPQLRVYP